MLMLSGVPVKKEIAPPRIVLIDLLRGASILLVLAIHLAFGRAVLHLPALAESSGSPAWLAFSGKGAYGVSIFFVLSGFLITRVLVRPGKSALESSDLREFYVRRAGRILPLLALIGALGAWVQHPSFAAKANFGFCYAAPVLRPGFWASIATFSFNWYRQFTETAARHYGLHWSVLWSLAVEEQYYLLYPPMLLALKTARRIIPALGLVMAAGLAWRIAAYLRSPDDAMWSLTSSFGAFDQIAAGCLLFFADRHLSADGREWTAPAARAVTAAGGALAIGVLAFTSLTEPLDRVYGPTALSLGIFLLLLGGLRLRVPETPATRALCLPGELSYGIYLLHASVLFFGGRWLLHSNPWIAYGIFILLNVAAAAVVFHAFEYPANRFVRGRFSARRVEEAIPVDG